MYGYTRYFKLEFVNAAQMKVNHKEKDLHKRLVRTRKSSFHKAKKENELTKG